MLKQISLFTLAIGIAMFLSTLKPANPPPPKETPELYPEYRRQFKEDCSDLTDQFEENYVTKAFGDWFSQ